MFNKLSRLKTWVQNRVVTKSESSVAVCHSHKDILDKMSLGDICQEFVQGSECFNVFGCF